MANLWIGFIPSNQEFVWDVSSEKIPHMTLLFLGEHDENVDEITQFVKHAADVSLKKFSMFVKKRDVLGDDKADVLFFDDFYAKELEVFRAHLLTHPKINKAFHAIDQFPTWTPHLTLGYPETPAKPMPKDVREFFMIEFDKIAVWTGDYDGPTFELESYGPIAEHSGTNMIEKAEKFLEHYGILGMKWGIRKDRGASGKGSLVDGKQIEVSSTNDISRKEALNIGKVVDEVRQIMTMKNRSETFKVMSSVNDKFDSQKVSSDPKESERYDREMSMALTKLAQKKVPKGARAAVVVDQDNIDLYVGTPLWFEAHMKNLKHEDSSEGAILSYRAIKDKSYFIVDIEPTDEVNHEDLIDGVLEHYGVLGMKWGIRKDPRTGQVRRTEDVVKDQAKADRARARAAKRSARAAKAETRAAKRELKAEQKEAKIRKTIEELKRKNFNPNESEDSSRAATAYAKGQSRGIESLSNRELADIQARINLEKNYRKLTAPPEGTKQRTLGGRLLDAALAGAVGTAERQIKSYTGNQTEKFINDIFGIKTPKNTSKKKNNTNTQQSKPKSNDNDVPIYNITSLPQKRR